MKKEARTKNDNELRPEYDLSQLKGVVRGKYYKQAMAGTNLVLIEPDLAKRFPDTASVNRALRSGGRIKLRDEQGYLRKD